MCARVRWTSLMLRACYTNSKEEAASTACITWKANKNNNNNNRCVKNNISTVAYCARSRARARAEMSLFSFVFFLLSFLSFLSLPRQRTERAAPNAKEQKMENILRLLLCSHHKAFFPRDVEAVLLTLLKNNQMKQRMRRRERKTGRKEERIHSIATTTTLHLNKTTIIIVYSFFFELNEYIEMYIKKSCIEWETNNSCTLKRKLKSNKKKRKSQKKKKE